MQPKKSKAAVGYKDGLPQAHCGICRHYDRGSCELVAGPIDASYWCTLFSRVGAKRHTVSGSDAAEDDDKPVFGRIGYAK